MPGPDLRLSQPAGRGLLFAAVLASGMVFLDGTVVNVALPSLGRDLDASLAGLQWTINAYMLTLAALVLLGGSLGDRYGRRRIFVLGVIWFTVASVLCGIAGNVEMLVASRALQGVGGALLTPGSLALIQASFHPDDRAKAIGAWSGLSGVATAVGPFLGGWLIDSLSWRWVFLLNVPFALVVLVMTARFVPESRDSEVDGHFDIAGAALGAAGLAGVTYALIAAPDSGASFAVLLSAFLGVAAFVVFAVVERRARAPMLPPDMFASRQFVAVNLVTLFVYAALSGVFFFLVVQLQTVANFSALLAGTALLPVTLIMLAFSARAGALGQRLGPRLPLTLGPAIAAVSTLGMLRIGSDPSYVFDVLPPVIGLGIGLTITVAPLTASVLAAVAVRHAGVASGVNNAVARAAGLLAVAALPLVVGLSGADYENPAQFERGFRGAVIACAALLAAGAVTAWLVVRNPERVAERVPAARTHCTLNTPPHDPGCEPEPAGAGPSRSRTTGSSG